MVMRIHLKPFALAFPLTLLVAAICPAAASQELERVIAAEPTPAGIAITVATGGCAKKADFQIASSPVDRWESVHRAAAHEARPLQRQLSRRPQIAIWLGGAETPRRHSAHAQERGRSGVWLDSSSSGSSSRNTGHGLRPCETPLQRIPAQARLAQASSPPALPQAPQPRLLLLPLLRGLAAYPLMEQKFYPYVAALLELPAR